VRSGRCGPNSRDLVGCMPGKLSGAKFRANKQTSIVLYCVVVSKSALLLHRFLKIRSGNILAAADSPNS
jgi:hypothetical protein